ncbi:MAG: hypothetical protein HQ559_08385, partial [Lentisphaerae bacterium]|nr:hypothetical protein [Lentisphaerota bacterium]
YYLLGMTRLHAELFTGMPWGTEHVCERTRETIGRLELALGELPTLSDVDRPEDLAALRDDPRFAEVLTSGPSPANGHVLVYYSPACPHCHQLMAYLDANGVDYEKRDATQVASARDEIKQLTGKLSIPVMVAGDEVVVGFDKNRLRTLLGIGAKKEKVGTVSSTRIPHVNAGDLAATVLKARDVLRDNCVEGRTRASQHLYPHQWNWDAGFIARGYLHFDPEQAYREIRLLFEGQWNDGFLPHMIFNEKHLDHFPGPDYWKAERSGRVPDGMHTSGISQPPVHASMLVAAPKLDPDKDRARNFLEEMYPRIKSLHDFFFTHRDPAGEGLVTLVHPWESGIDNAPIWDEPLAAIEESSPWAKDMQERYDALAEEGKRPKRSYIEKYSYLVESLFSRGFEWDTIAASHPFQIQDVLFNAVLCRAERDLAGIAEAIDRDPAPHRHRAERMADAMNSKLWDEKDGLYYSYDLRAGRPLKRDTVFSYLPLYAGVCDNERSRTLIDNLRSHCFCVADRNCVGIPTYDMCQADYRGDFYWRGPVWFNMCWYMVDAFYRYGESETADWLADSLLQLVVENGFYEYYEPETGKGLGADGFSWTAALFLDLAAERDRAANGPQKM